MGYDVIILGLGAMGSAAADHLARRGTRVLGLDRFQPPHDRGSSHGRSRIIREAYWEHPAYVPLVRRAYELWAELEEDARRLLLLTTGGLMVGAPESDLIRGSLASATTHALPHEVLDAAAIRNRFPVFQPTDDVVAVHEPRAGVLFPEECVLAHLQRARRAGAELHYDDPVVAWSAGPGRVSVQTLDQRYEAGALVITAGPWAPEMLADLALPLVIERQVVGWFQPVAQADAFDPERCPVFVWQTPDQVAGARRSGPGAFGHGRFFYGFPQLGIDGVKIAEHALGHPTTAETIRREIGPGEIDDLRRSFITPYLPAADGPLLASTTCMYTMTPDVHFVIDRHPLFPTVLVACGFSGHGFKFAPVVGEILADLVVDGESRHDISLFTMARFPRGGSAAPWEEHA